MQCFFLQRYMPKSAGQKGFDSVYWKGDTILLFDMTVSYKEQYSINGPGIVDALKAIDKPSTACVQFCFVVPKEKFDDFRLKSYVSSAKKSYETSVGAEKLGTSLLAFRSRCTFCPI